MHSQVASGFGGNCEGECWIPWLKLIRSKISWSRILTYLLFSWIPVFLFCLLSLPHDAQNITWAQKKKKKNLNLKQKTYMCINSTKVEKAEKAWNPAYSVGWDSGMQGHGAFKVSLDNLVNSRLTVRSEKVTVEVAEEYIDLLCQHEALNLSLHYPHSCFSWWYVPVTSADSGDREENHWNNKLQVQWETCIRIKMESNRGT